MKYLFQKDTETEGPLKSVERDIVALYLKTITTDKTSDLIMRFTRYKIFARLLIKFYKMQKMIVKNLTLKNSFS